MSSLPMKRKRSTRAKTRHQLFFCGLLLSSLVMVRLFINWLLFMVDGLLLTTAVIDNNICNGNGRILLFLLWSSSNCYWHFYILFLILMIILIDLGRFEFIGIPRWGRENVKQNNAGNFFRRQLIFISKIKLNSSSWKFGNGCILFIASGIIISSAQLEFESIENDPCCIARYQTNTNANQLMMVVEVTEQEKDESTTE